MVEDVESLSEHSKECKIETVPTLIELFSFEAYPCTCIVGPFNEFRVYLNFIEGKGRYENVPISASVILRRFFGAFGCFGVSLLLGNFADPNVLTTPEFGELPFYWKCIHATLMVKNFVYSVYACWFFSDSANAASGYSYSGKDKDGNFEFNYLKTKFVEMELGASPREVINAWNHQISIWLRFYVYEQILGGKKENRDKATFMAFFVSAIWHGFYPGYYIYFGYINVLLSIHRKMRILMASLPENVSTILGWIATNHI